MVYTIIIENKAQKEFLKLSPPHDNSIKKGIAGLEKEPRPHGVKKLSRFTGFVTARKFTDKIFFVA